MAARGGAACPADRSSVCWFDSSFQHEVVEVGGIESDVPPDLVERDSAFVDEASHESKRHAESFCCLADVDEPRFSTSWWHGCR